MFFSSVCMILMYALCMLLGGVVLNQLLDWLRFHFVEGTRLAQEAMQDESPEKHPDYWNAVSHYPGRYRSLLYTSIKLPYFIIGCNRYVLSFIARLFIARLLITVTALQLQYHYASMQMSAMPIDLMMIINYI